MKEVYTEYNFTVKPKNPATEILIAELAEAGFENFKETENGVLAYVLSEKDNKNILSEIYVLDSIVFDISYKKKKILPQNWNTQWEENFQPIEINSQCRIRASFHPKKEVEYDIIINPKMAFGTGHHATTHLMMNFILEETLKGKTVLDMGCGTGVLSILAEQKKAKKIDAIDIDEWSYKNTKENIILNQCQNITAFKGEVSLIKNKKYDVIFANINRNILLNDIPEYEKSLAKNGVLLLSGFYEEDIPMIKEKAFATGLKYVDQKIRNHWTALKFIKS